MARPLPATPLTDLRTVLAIARETLRPEDAAAAVTAAFHHHGWSCGTWADWNHGPFVVVEVSKRHEMVLVMPTGYPAVDGDVYDLSIAEALDLATALADGRQLPRGDVDALRATVAAIAINHPR